MKRFHTQGLVAIVAGAAMLPLLAAAPAHAATWSGSVQLSDPRPYSAGPPVVGDNVTYTATISSGVTTTANAVKCLVIEFDTSADGTGGIPSGLTDLTTATLSGTLTTSQVLSGFTADTSSAASGILRFTNATGGTGQAGTIILAGVQNGTVADNDFYIRYNTFNNTNCSSSSQDSFITAAIYTNQTVATITVEQSLTYTINAISAASTCNGVTTTDASTSTALDLRPTVGANKVAGQRHDIATNASGGYSLYMRQSQKPTSGSNDIDDLATATYGSPTAFSAAGTEAWGFSTNDATLAGGTANRFTSPSAAWAPLATSSPGDAVATSSTPVTGAGGQTQICFQVGVGATTSAGVYTTNIIYTASGNF